LASLDNWIACPSANFDCSCFYGAANTAYVQGGSVGQAFFQLLNFCRIDGYLNFFLDADSVLDNAAPSYNFYEAKGDGTVLGTCTPQTSHPFSHGALDPESQWTVCQNATSPIDFPYPDYEETTTSSYDPALDGSDSPPGGPGSICIPSCAGTYTVEFDFNYVSDYYVCSAPSSLSCGDA